MATSQNNDLPIWIEYLKAFGPVIQAIGVVLAAGLGATLFKWNESWHNAEQMNRAVSGITLNYMRHAATNLRRISENIHRDDKAGNEKQENISDSELINSYTFSAPSIGFVRKLAFDQENLSETMKDGNKLFSKDLISKIAHLSLRVRNINIEIELATSNLNEHAILDKNDNIIFYNSFILRNARILQSAGEIHQIVEHFERLNQSMGLLSRFNFIYRNQRTLFSSDEKIVETQIGSGFIAYIIINWRYTVAIAIFIYIITQLLGMLGVYFPAGAARPLFFILLSCLALALALDDPRAGANAGNNIDRYPGLEEDFDPKIFNKFRKIIGYRDDELQYITQLSSDAEKLQNKSRTQKIQ